MTYPIKNILEDPISEENMLVFLDLAGSGCISGKVTEWPQLKPACKWAAKLLREHKAARLDLAQSYRNGLHERVQKLESTLRNVLDYWEPPCSSMSCNKGFHVDQLKLWNKACDLINYDNWSKNEK